MANNIRRAIRARQKKYGETYSTARMHILCERGRGGGGPNSEILEAYQTWWDHIEGCGCAMAMARSWWCKEGRELGVAAYRSLVGLHGEVSQRAMRIVETVYFRRPCKRCGHSFVHHSRIPGFPCAYPVRNDGQDLGGGNQPRCGCEGYLPEGMPLVGRLGEGQAQVGVLSSHVLESGRTTACSFTELADRIVRSGLGVSSPEEEAFLEAKVLRVLREEEPLVETFDVPAPPELGAFPELLEGLGQPAMAAEVRALVAEGRVRSVEAQARARERREELLSHLVRWWEEREGAKNARRR